MQLGENIYKYRTERGLSQGALAAALEVSRQSVSKWENGSATPELDKLLKMSTIFDVTLDELVHGRKEKSALPPTAPANPLSHISPRLFMGCAILLFGMVFFLLSVFWGNQLRFGEEFGELVSITIVLVSIALIATYNHVVLAGCAVIYFIYGVVSEGIMHVTSMTNYVFLFLAGLIILIWFIILGLHETKQKGNPPENTTSV